MTISGTPKDFRFYLVQQSQNLLKEIGEIK